MWSYNYDGCYGKTGIEQWEHDRKIWPIQGGKERVGFSYND
jgi:hypothetical protein